MATGDTYRFKRLIEPHLDTLFRAAFRLTRNAADAEDLAQETCLRGYERMGELRESQPVRAWLLTVLHNLFVDGARRSARSPVTTYADAYALDVSASPEPNPEDHACMAEREVGLERAWSKLDRDHRALLALRVEGYSLTEISEITALPVAALHARLYRARRSLAQHLCEETPAEAGIGMEIAK